jgi:hypothetical protein
VDVLLAQSSGDGRAGRVGGFSQEGGKVGSFF